MITKIILSRLVIIPGSRLALKNTYDNLKD